jgi:hypothetical protein
LGEIEDEMSNGLIQSYVKNQWMVSTIHRESSAMLAAGVWYYETLVWNWDAEKRERTNMIAQYDSGISEQSAFSHHFLVCKTLPQEVEG